MRTVASYFFLLVVFLFVISCRTAAKRVATHTDQPLDSTVALPSPEYIQKQISDSLTMLETMFSKNNAVIVRDKYLIGEKWFGGRIGTGRFSRKESIFRLQAVVAYDPSSPQTKLRGLYVETGTKFDPERKHVATPNSGCYIHIAEIGQLLSMIDSVGALSERWHNIEKEESQASLSTRSGFAVSVFQRGKEQLLFYGCGGQRFVEGCYVSDISELIEVKTLLEDGLKRLKTL